VVKPSNRSVAAARRHRLFARAFCAGVLVGLGGPLGAQSADEPAPVAEPPAEAASAAWQAEASAASAVPARKRFRTATDMDQAYGLELKQYVNRLGFLVRRHFTFEAPDVPSPDPKRLGQRSRRPFQFPQPLVVALRYDAEGKYLDFDYIERTGNFRTDTDAGRALQRSVWLLSPPPIPPGSTKPFTVWIRFDERNFILAPAAE
jgi:hypothetical protein